MIAVLIAFALLTVAALLVMLAPLRRTDTAPSPTAEDDALGALREEYAELLAQIREIDRATGAGEVDADLAARERLQLQGRAARALALIESHVDSERTAGRRFAPRSGLRAALVGLGVVAAVMVAASFTVLPAWQLAGLRGSETRALQAAVRVAPLARQAQRTNDPDDWRELGRAAFDAGRFEHAARAYGELLRADTRDAEALRRLGILLLSRGEKEREAASLIMTAARLAPNDAEGQLYLGFLLARAGEREDALAALERYRSLNPQGREADELISELRAQGGVRDEGMVVYGASCSSCHGPEGRGGVGPDLRATRLPRAAQEQLIRRGVGSMPGFPDLTGAQMTALLDLMDRWQGDNR